MTESNVKIKYFREDREYDGWSLWIWEFSKGDKGFEIQPIDATPDFISFEIPVSKYNLWDKVIGVLPKYRTWLCKDIADRFIYMHNQISGYEIYHGNPAVYPTGIIESHSNKPESKCSENDSTDDLKLISFMTKLTGKENVQQNEIVKARTEMIEELEEMLDKFIEALDCVNFDSEYTNFNELNSSFKKWKNELHWPWIRGKTIIALAGRFSAGKSSILNSIFEDDLLAIGQEPTTAVPTFITNDVSINDGCVLAMDTEKRTVEIEFNEFKNFTHLNKNEIPYSLFLEYFVIGKNRHDILDGVSILDTPGFDSTYSNDRKITSEALESSDYTFWVVALQDGTIGLDSLNFLKNHLYGKPVYVILTRIDNYPAQLRNKRIESVSKEILENAKKCEIDIREFLPITNKKSDSFYKEGRDNLKKLIKSLSCKSSDQSKASLNGVLEKIKKLAVTKLNSDVAVLRQSIREYKQTPDSLCNCKSDRCREIAIKYESRVETHVSKNRKLKNEILTKFNDIQVKIGDVL